MMKILHINYNDNSGGASEITTLLSTSLNQIGYNSRIIVLEKTTQFRNGIYQIGNKNTSDIEKQNQQYINESRSDLTNTFFSYTNTYRKEIIEYIIKNKFDILHLHWIEKYISLELLYELNKLNIPIIWTIHDERIYTAGCHCTFGCKEFIKDCKDCIQLKNGVFFTETEFNRRLKILNNLNIQYIAPSNWILGQAKKSKILHNKSIKLINHGIDTNIYKPNNKYKSNILTIVFMAANLDAKHKNLDDFIKILKYIEYKINFDIKVYLIGNSSCEQKYSFCNKIKIIHKSFIRSKKDLIKIFQQSHILINTSLCESFSLVTAEAMSCGCVPLTYLTGGISDIVDNETAYVFDQNDYVSMANQLLFLLNNPKKIDEKSVKAREQIINLFSIEKMRDKYIEIYNKINLTQKKTFNLIEKKSKKVTVVTVVYNAEDYLEKTFKSIFLQTSFEDIEYIVIDGGSTDKTLEIINKYKDKIDIFISEPDDGVYYAMNKAINLSTGQWINFMNAGDSFYNKWVVEKLIKQVDDTSELIYGDVNVIDKGIDKIIKADLENRIFKETPFCHQSLFVKSSLMKEKKFDTTYKVLADYHFILNAYLENKKMQYLDFVVSKYQLGGMSKQNVKLMHLEGVHILMVAQKYNKNIVIEESNFYKRHLSFIGVEKQYETTREELYTLSEISFKRHPLKKYRQYKVLLKTFFNERET